MHYRIEPSKDVQAAAILETTLRSFVQDDQMQNDLKRLGQACCERQRFVTLMGAPAPVLQSMASD